MKLKRINVVRRNLPQESLQLLKNCLSIRHSVSHTHQTALKTSHQTYHHHAVHVSQCYDPEQTSSSKESLEL